MRKLSLNTLYGKKPAQFIQFILACQSVLSDSLLDSFLPYEINQIHGTIVSVPHNYSSILNPEYCKSKHNYTKIDLIAYLNEIKSCMTSPILIRIGGFKENDLPFLSKGKFPYYRSFSIQDKKAIMIGWPILSTSKDSYSNILGKIRGLGEKYNIKHIYNEPGFIDNEYYFRIGLINDTTNHNKVSLAERLLRDYISKMEPIMLEITINDIHLVSYQDERLPIKSSKVLGITKINTTDDILSLLK